MDRPCRNEWFGFTGRMRAVGIMRDNAGLTLYRDAPLEWMCLRREMVAECSRVRLRSRRDTRSSYGFLRNAATLDMRQHRVQDCTVLVTSPRRVSWNLRWRAAPFTCNEAENGKVAALERGTDVVGQHNAGIPWFPNVSARSEWTRDCGDGRPAEAELFQVLELLVIRHTEHGRMPCFTGLITRALRLNNNTTHSVIMMHHY